MRTYQAKCARSIPYRTKRRAARFTHALICASILWIGGCGESDDSASKTVVIGYLPISAHLPAAIAEKNGDYGDLDIEFRVFGSSNDLLSALKRGDVHFATTVALAPIARLAASRAEEGAPMPVAVVSSSVTSSANPFDSVFVKKDSTIKSLGDLVGKRVGLFPGTTAKHVVSYALTKHLGLTLGSTKWVYLPPRLQISALRSGDIDALYTYETVRTVAELNDMRQVHGSVVATLLEGAPFGCSAINVKFARQHPELIRRCISAFDAGIAVVRDSPSDARRILIEKLAVSEDVAARCHLEQRLKSTELWTDKNRRVMKKFLVILAAMGEVKATVAPAAVLWKP